METEKGKPGRAPKEKGDLSKKETKSVINGYEIENSEKNSYHVQLEKMAYDKLSGKKLSTPYIQKFTVEEWEKPMASKTIQTSEGTKTVQVFMKDLLKQDGYTITIKYEPIKEEE